MQGHFWHLFLIQLFIAFYALSFRIFEISGFWCCHGEQNAGYHIKEHKIFQTIYRKNKQWSGIWFSCAFSDIIDKFLLKSSQMTSRCWQVARVAGISVTPEDFQKLFRMPSMVILNYPPQLSTEHKTILTQLQVWWLMTTTSCFFALSHELIASKNLLFLPSFSHLLFPAWYAPYFSRP